MKRSPLVRKTPMARASSPMGRSTKRLRTVRAKKEHPRPVADDRRMPRRKDHEYLRFVEDRECCALVGMCSGDVVAHHYPAGHAKDDALTVPLCFEHHINRYHQDGLLEPMTSEETHDYFKAVQLRLHVEWRDDA